MRYQSFSISIKLERVYAANFFNLTIRFEMLNPSEVFGDIMIDYSYVECTSACVTALAYFSKAVPNYRSNEVLRAIQKGAKFVESIQRSDGSWYGSWGNCFTYGTWFGLEALIVAGRNRESPSVQVAVQFLLGKQNVNGGWGESYLACVNKAYPEIGTGQVDLPSIKSFSECVQTSFLNNFHIYSSISVVGKRTKWRGSNGVGITSLTRR